MKKICIVAQRAGKDILGGSEGYALKLGEVLSSVYNVDIITTTAKEYTTWRNYYKEGTEILSDNLRIKRFNVDCERDENWQNIANSIFKNLKTELFSSLDGEIKKEEIKKIRTLPLGIQIEFILFQGPTSFELLDYIKHIQDEYYRIIFMTYLYFPTFFGVDLIKERDKVLICPTFHDEPVAYFPVFSKYFKYKLLFLSESEMRLAMQLSEGDMFKFRVIRYGLEDKFSEKDTKGLEKYAVYTGRLDKGKGVGKLIEYFKKFKKEYRQIPLKLYILGEGDMEIPASEDIIPLGFVSEIQKMQTLRNAFVFIHPSPYESLSISLIEAFMFGVPCIVNKESEVLREHVEKSLAGLTFGSYDEFCAALLKMLNDKDHYNELSINARQYFIEYYDINLFRERLIEALEE